MWCVLTHTEVHFSGQWGLLPARLWWLMYAFNKDYESCRS